MKPHPKCVVPAGDSYLKGLFIFLRQRLASLPCQESIIESNLV